MLEAAQREVKVHAIIFVRSYGSWEAYWIDAPDLVAHGETPEEALAELKILRPRRVK